MALFKDNIEGKDIKRNNYIGKLVESFLIILFPLITFFILGPVEIYVSNKNQFFFQLSDFIYFLLTVSLVSGAILALLVNLLPDKIRTIILFFVFSLTFAAYLQNMFFNKDLIKADGSAMDWNLYSRYTVINGAVWIFVLLILLVIFFITKMNIRFIKLGAAFITVIEIVALISVIIPVVADNTGGISYVFSGKDQFSIAPNDNIIVLCLDHYANNDFEKMYREHSEDVEAVMHDFTYYNNADSKYNYTFPSMPHFMTGKNLNVDLTLEEWQQSIWDDSDTQKFYDLLHVNGYSVLVFSNEEANYVLGDLGRLDSMIDNVEPMSSGIDGAIVCKLLVKMSLYRYAPYLVKPVLETASNAFSQVYGSESNELKSVYSNGEFAENLLTRGLTVNKQFDNLYTLIHIQGMHAPFELYRNGLSSLPANTDMSETSQGLNCILREYFDQLKQLGLYDNATIIVMSDHGTGEISPQPIFFIKNKNETHDSMVINSAPISYDDYRATIINLSGIDSNEFGTSIFDWSEGQQRERQLWFPNRGDGYDVYTYSEDREELLYKIANGEYEHIIAKTVDKWHTLDDPLFREKLIKQGIISENSVEK